MDIVYCNLFQFIHDSKDKKGAIYGNSFALSGAKHSENEESILMNVEKNLTLLRTLNLIDKKISKNINNFNMYSYQEK
jgi:hypothetical protein